MRVLKKIADKAILDVSIISHTVDCNFFYMRVYPKYYFWKAKRTLVFINFCFSVKSPCPKR